MSDMDMNGEVEPRVGRSELEDIQMQSNQVTDEVSQKEARKHNRKGDFRYCNLIYRGDYEIEFC